jgi:hypothetical protein
MAMSFETTQIFNDSREAIFAKCIVAANECGFKIIFQNTDRFTLVAIKKTLLTKGNSLMIVVSEDGGVSMKSECVNSGAFFDWGQNRVNVELFFDRLRNGKGSSQVN